MPVRLGVDVGGTFTKAVAVDAASGRVVARAVVPTTHRASVGIAEGAVAALTTVASEVRVGGFGPVLSVGHSTTLAVNALLEGDLPVVGLVGIGRAPDLGPARKRTDLGRIELAPGRSLTPRYRFLDATTGLTAEAAGRAVADLAADGAQAIAVSEAFGVEDPSGERRVLEAAADAGIPACAGHQLTGALGLELRTLSALVNAAILPRARSTVQEVEAGLRRAGIDAPLLVLRGDGGATDPHGFARAPLASLFSGPAASVAGALHHVGTQDAVMLEVGGTSTNIALVRGGRPRLAYVRVAGRSTCVRALDVWVAGVAGGSLARVRGRDVRVVGPRSAHVAGLPYASFATPESLEDARALLLAPLPGDPADHLVVDARGGRFALTVTCAANAVGAVTPGGHAMGSSEAARAAFAAAGRLLRRDPETLAHQVLSRAADALAATVRAALRDAGSGSRLASLVGVGGGASALLPTLARALRVPASVAPDAEVLSSIGAAASLVQATVERALAASAPESVAGAVDEAERGAIAAGAAPASVETRTEFDEARRIVRAVATGSLPLEAGTDAGTSGPRHVAAGMDTGRAARRLGVPVERIEEVAATGPYRAFTAAAAGRTRPWVLLDARGATAYSGEAEWLATGRGDAFASEVVRRIRASERHVGPVAVAPAVVLAIGRHLLDLTPLTDTSSVTAAVERALAAASDDAIVAVERVAR